MPIASSYTFAADPTRRPAHAHKDSPKTPEPYIAADALIQAVNLAIFLHRPLLLEGEAGCGKSMLARAVAYELGLPFYRWDVRSTSKAQEGLYTYDAILRLHDVQTVKAGAGQPPRDPADPVAYRKLGALGKAFALTECPAVVLIDEIDKADVDFPNDLLTVLDEPWELHIPETGEPPIQATHYPIVIVTSNKEKGNLPAPFLRRCLYHYIDFPEQPEQLQRIVEVHYRVRGDAAPAPALVTAATTRFLALRRQGRLHKVPGTSEFLDWLGALHRFGSQAPVPSTDLEDERAPLPYPELLYKLRIDWQSRGQEGSLA
ncbi:MAG: MoxR family ATPase [Caldilinea sp.]|nr:MoxR family ATPase [Caldilineaceae bacterium]MCO5211467.1 MoxR family ATPase [Caldilinea sp.]HRW50410.1 MoxR family ATPase [Caldilinea sp.]